MKKVNSGAGLSHEDRMEVPDGLSFAQKREDLPSFRFKKILMEIAPILYIEDEKMVSIAFLCKHNSFYDIFMFWLTSVFCNLNSYKRDNIF